MSEEGRVNSQIDDSMVKSLAIQRAAARLGFDWPDAFGVLEKIKEESEEIDSALRSGDQAQAQRELGDLLFSVVNLSRFLKVDPGEALREAADRFARRFSVLTTEVARQGRRMETCTLEELDTLWNRVKMGME